MKRKARLKEGERTFYDTITLSLFNESLWNNKFTPSTSGVVSLLTAGTSG